MNPQPTPLTVDQLPGLDCGLCGVRTCRELADRLLTRPELRERCIPLSSARVQTTMTGAALAAGGPPATPAALANPSTQSSRPSPWPGAGAGTATATAACGSCAPGVCAPAEFSGWRDTLGREFDFYLEHFPEEPGPREIILPHNPLITRELDLQPGDTLIGRPLGMSCGCPITHCGVVTESDHRTGVVTWCVTGPLNPRQNGYKDIGYYIAEAYEGLITDARTDIRIGMRYFFQPRMCMLQWRHSGLVNYLNRGRDGLQVRVEGLWIG